MRPLLLAGRVGAGRGEERERERESDRERERERESERERETGEDLCIQWSEAAEDDILDKNLGIARPWWIGACWVGGVRNEVTGVGPVVTGGVSGSPE